MMFALVDKNTWNIQYIYIGYNIQIRTEQNRTHCDICDVRLSLYQ